MSEEKIRQQEIRLECVRLANGDFIKADRLYRFVVGEFDSDFSRFHSGSIEMASIEELLRSE